MNILLKDLNDEINNPSGNWADYNCLYRSYELIKDIADKGNGMDIFCTEDVPSEPQIEDYPDLEEPKDVDCEPL